jgi:hypothetical protein
MKRTAVCFATLLILAVVPNVCAQRQPKAASQPAKPGQKAGGSEDKAGSSWKALPEPAEWAPADALFYVGITDVTQAWDDLKRTSTFASLGESAAASTSSGLNPIGTAIEELKSRLGKALDVPPGELESPFGGPLTFYIATPAGDKLDKIEPGLVAGVRDAELMKKYYDAVVAKLEGLGKKEAVKEGANTIDVFTLTPAKGAKGAGKGGADEFAKLDEEPGAGLTRPDQMMKKGLDELFSAKSLPPTLALCLTEDRLIVGSSTQYVQGVLKREKSAKSLADSDEHKTLLEKLKPTGDIRFFVNLPRIIELAQAAGEGADAKDVRKQVRALGLDKLGAVVGHVRVGASSYDWKAEALLLLYGQRVGLAKLMSLENRPTAPPESVPAETCFYVSCNVSPPELLSQIEQMMREVDPQGAQRMQAALQMPQADGKMLNLRTEFLDRLEGPLMGSLALTQPLGPNCVRLLLGIGQRDRDAVVRVLGGPLSQGMLMPRDAKGSEVFDVAPLPMLGGGLAVAATKNRLVLGNTAAVEEALASQASTPLAQSETWRRAARFVPEQSSLTFYMDSRKLMDALIELTKKPPEASANAAGPDFGTVVLMGMLQSMGGDTKQMEQVRRYAAPTIYTISTTPDGVQFTAVQLKP